MSFEGSNGRTVVIGGSGFIGRHVVSGFRHSGREVLSLSSTDVDLQQDGAVDTLTDLIKETDEVVFLAAITPDRGNDIDSFLKNLSMSQSFLLACERRKPAYVCYVGTDGGYGLGEETIDENTVTRPTDWYSTSHLVREEQFRSALEGRLSIVRPTIVYGPGDPHGGYGPNKFVRDAIKKGIIRVKGNGEERRDFLYISDAAELIVRVCQNRYLGLLNLASGQSTTFLRVAEYIREILGEDCRLMCLERDRPVTHRYFNIDNIKALFPDFQPTVLREGIKHYVEFEGGISNG